MRLESLMRCDVLDTPREESFDRITRLAAAVMDTPIALITFIDARRQWSKSSVGTEITEIPRDISFCAHAIRGETAFVVPDATEDARFSTNPLVTGGPGIRFYLGIPLRLQDGQAVGTLCVVDTRPRVPTQMQVDLLSDLARIVINELELRHLALTDGLTGALTRRGIVLQVQAEVQRSIRYRRAFSVIAIDLDHFKEINDRFGHAKGDLVLRMVVDCCRLALRGSDTMGRTGGDEFIVLLPETSEPVAGEVAERLRGAIESIEFPSDLGLPGVTASLGLITLCAAEISAAEAMHLADIALYEAKAQGRNRISVAALRSAG